MAVVCISECGVGRGFRAGLPFVCSSPTLVNLCTHTLQLDRTYSYVMSSPPTSYFLKAAAGLEKGAAQPGHEEAGSISVKHVYEIALVKAKDPAFEGVPLQSVCRCIAASARSMGISITK